MKNWHSKKLDDIKKELKTDLTFGLSETEALTRLKEGKNELKSKPPKKIWQLFLLQLTDKMIIILLIAALISFIINEKVDTLVILIVVLINAIISVIQEKKAADAVAALKKMNAPYASVLRDGKLKKILVSNLVRGDIVYLEDGSIVPADLRLINENNLMIDESSLTGESMPVEKDEEVILKEDTPLAEMCNMAFSSTIVNCGTGVGIVVETGMNTEVGKIANMLDSSSDDISPLKKKLNQVGKILSILGIIVSIIIFIIGFMQGKDVTTLLMISISLAISVIPEGLPATATVVMAFAVQRMAQKNALVKKLHSVETLGSASVICTDKTGTLTQNKMSVIKVYDFNSIYLKKELEKTNELLINNMVLCNNATYDKDKLIGDPTEGALLDYAKNNDTNVNKLRDKYERVYEKPFDSERKMMTVACKQDGEYVLYTKGATEELLEKCSYVKDNAKIRKITSEDKKIIINNSYGMSQEALRVLSFAYKNINEIPNEEEACENDLIFVGMIGMIDPPRKESFKSIKECQKAGIKVIMITGDHKLTAVSIAKKIGIYKEGDKALSTTELSKLSDEELKKEIKNISVLARVTPKDKLRVVNALKENKEVVAMTGDGVNDSPALKAADIGVAMGITGTDVSKEAADMILLDDNFSTIGVAIKEGRRVYKNIQKVIQFLLAGNIAEVLSVFASIVLNLPNPFLAIHILFINLVTDILPALALGVDPANDDIMEKPPVKGDSLFEKGLIKRVIFYGIYISIITMIGFIIGIKDDPKTGTTMAFLVLCLSQIVHALNQHSNIISIFSKKHKKNKYLYLAMFLSALLLVPVMAFEQVRNFFSLSVLNLNEWLIVGVLAISPLIVVEIFKLIRRKKHF